MEYTLYVKLRHESTPVQLSFESAASRDFIFSDFCRAMFESPKDIWSSDTLVIRLEDIVMIRKG